MAKYGEIELGDRVRAKIDGFEGIASGITEYLHQCRQVFVKPEKLTSDGGAHQGLWVDEPWLDLVTKAVHKPTGVMWDPSVPNRVASGAEGSHHSPSVPALRRGSA